MNKLWLSLLLLGGSFLSFAHTGSIEVNTGGFSFIPAFTSREPNLIINAGTNPQKRLTGHLMYMMRNDWL
jgi:NADH:ubiquinone oxidoreductase subunit B-like Fe-S oxidoreductase